MWIVSLGSFLSNMLSTYSIKFQGTLLLTHLDIHIGTQCQTRCFHLIWAVLCQIFWPQIKTPSNIIKNWSSSLAGIPVGCNNKTNIHYDGKLICGFFCSKSDLIPASSPPGTWVVIWFDGTIHYSTIQWVPSLVSPLVDTSVIVTLAGMIKCVIYWTSLTLHRLNYWSHLPKF